MPLDQPPAPSLAPLRPSTPSPIGLGPLAFVSDWPRDAELAAGKPMGRGPGLIFHAALRSANVPWREALICHAYPRDPRELTADEKLAAETHLVELLAKTKPRVVVPLGQDALKALAPKALLSAVRGTFFYAQTPAGRFTICPTFHPETVAKVWTQYIVMVGDVIRAASQLVPEIVYPKRELIVSPTIEEVESFLKPEALKAQGPLLSVDIETGWKQIRGISFAPCESRAIYVPFISLHTPSRSYWPTIELELRAWDAVRAALECDMPKLGQNFAGYDAQWLLQRAGIRVKNLLHDLRLLHAALYPELPKSLAAMSQAYSKQGAWKQWGREDRMETAEKRDA